MEIYWSLCFSQNEEEVLLLGGVHEFEGSQGTFSEDTYEAFINHLKTKNCHQTFSIYTMPLPQCDNSLPVHTSCDKVIRHYKI